MNCILAEKREESDISFSCLTSSYYSLVVYISSYGSKGVHIFRRESIGWIQSPRHDCIGWKLAPQWESLSKDLECSRMPNLWSSDLLWLVCACWVFESASLVVVDVSQGHQKREWERFSLQQIFRWTMSCVTIIMICSCKRQNVRSRLFYGTDDAGLTHSIWFPSKRAR